MYIRRKLAQHSFSVHTSPCGCWMPCQSVMHIALLTSQNDSTVLCLGCRLLLELQVHAVCNCWFFAAFVMRRLCFESVLENY